MTSHDPELMTLIDLKTSMIVSIAITEKIGMLHIKQKLKTATLQRKYGQDITCNKNFAVLDHMTSHDPELTFNDPN